MARQARMTLEVRLIVDESATTPAGAGDEVARLRHQILYSKELTSGTTDATEVDRVWSSSASLTASPTDLDLLSATTSKLDSGLTNGFVDLVCLAVANDGAAGDIQVGAGSNPVAGVWLAAGDGVAVKPGGFFLWVAPSGIAPVAGTGDILRLVTSSGTIAGRAMIVGRSA